jgi:hypothetical protein
VGDTLSFTPYELSGNLYLVTEDSAFQGQAVATGFDPENVGVGANAFFGYMMGAIHNIPPMNEAKLNVQRAGQVYKLPERAVRYIKLEAVSTQKEREDFLKEVALLEALTDDDRSKVRTPASHPAHVCQCRCTSAPPDSSI